MKTPPLSLHVALFACFLCLLHISACKKWNLDKIDFLDLEITEVQHSLDCILIKAEVKDLKSLDNAILSYGLIWTTKGAPINMETFEESRRVGSLTAGDPDGKFEVAIPLTDNANYTIAAYATTDNDRFFYSDPYLIGSEVGVVTTAEIFYPGGFSLELHGSLTGISSDVNVVKHGFCWSNTNEEPTVEDEKVDLGGITENATFSHEVSLDSGMEHTPCYVRAYVNYEFDGMHYLKYGKTKSFDGDLTYWTLVTEYPGRADRDAAAFVIDGIVYVGTGRLFDFNPDLPVTGTINDFWAYDPVADFWTEKDTFPAEIEGNHGRYYAVGVSNGTVGYVGTGTNQYGGSGRKNDWWKYDPATNSWDSLSPLPINEYTLSTSFFLDGRIYTGTGLIYQTGLNSGSSFYRFTPEENSWTRIADYGGGAAWACLNFTIGDKAYVGNSFSSEFWEYDPSTGEMADDGLPKGTWTRNANLPIDQPRFSFSIGQKGYMGGRVAADSVNWYLWEYDPDPVINSWTLVTVAPPFRGYKSGAISRFITFTLNREAYVGLVADEDGNPTKNIYKFNP